MDFESKTLRVSEKRRERIVPLSNWMLDEFKEWLAVKPWPEWRRDTLYHRLRKLCDAAGLPAHVTLQALRRTFLKRMLDAGVPIANCAAIAGNSPGVISKHYVELSTLDSHKYVNVLNFASGSAAKPAPEPVKPKPQKLASFLQRRQS